MPLGPGGRSRTKQEGSACATASRTLDSVSLFNKRYGSYQDWTLKGEGPLSCNRTNRRPELLLKQSLSFTLAWVKRWQYYDGSTIRSVCLVLFSLDDEPQTCAGLRHAVIRGETFLTCLDLILAPLGAKV